MEMETKTEDNGAPQTKDLSGLNRLIEGGTIVVGQSSYIKLMQNNTAKRGKSYSWEIKQLSLDIDELEKLNEIMVTKFGEEEIDGI